MKKEREKRESAAQPVDTRLVGKPPAEGAQLSMCVPNRSRFREIEVEKWIWRKWRKEERGNGNEEKEEEDYVFV